jgi:TolB protein
MDAAIAPRLTIDRQPPEDNLPRIARLVLTFVAFAWLATAPARAQLTIEIVGGAGTAIPISVVPFENESSWPLGITGIVSADLTRSGLFRMVDDAGISPRPVRAEDVRGGLPRRRRAVAVGRERWAKGARRSFAGRHRAAGAARVDELRHHARAVRATAHKIADIIYEA